ncbi:unnamed protein product [Parnassius apollo]|uniref:E3 ubiquitin-protein ligase n=1 Tax=Parnassius apollo TaxID=110799 RepID=A0A8S3XZZ0_PARAO|nr:unnamed protein product [Parnassius apollo]
MGNDHSSEFEKKIREAQTQAAYERALEKQRKLYEERLRQYTMQLQSAQEGSNIPRNTRTDRVGVASTSANINNNTSPDVVERPRYTPIASTSTCNSSFEFVNNHTTSTRTDRVGVASTSAPINNKLTLAKGPRNIPITSTSTGNSSFVNNHTTRVIPSAPPAPLNEPTNTNRQQSKRNSERNEFSCPTCGNRFGLTIFQCGSGHSSCRDCKINGSMCGTLNCGKTITDMRNRTLEALIADINLAAVTSPSTGANKSEKTKPDRQCKINCPNQQDGCRLRIRSTELENHLKECPFNEMACPLTALFGRCFWRGKINQLGSHFADFHPEHQQAGVDKEMIVQNTKNDNRIVHLVLIGTFYFLFHIKIDTSTQMLYMSTQLLGTESSAAKWNYEIHIYNKKQPRRKYEYLDVCLSNGTSIDEIFGTNKCAVIPLAYITTFENNGALNYKFYIKKRNDE